MKFFYLSYHSVGIFLVFLIAFIQTLFLVFKKDKKPASYWLIGLFAGFSIMLFGYFLAYSIYSPGAAYHRYLTVFVLFANANMSGFAYAFPRDDFAVERHYAVPAAFLIALIAYFQFIYKTIGTEKIYNFDAHLYTFDYGASTAFFILLLFLWPLIVLVRKTILYSPYDGKLAQHITDKKDFVTRLKITFFYFCIGSWKVIKPIGRDAKAVRTFILVIILLITTAVSNVLNKNGILPYDYYAIFYSNSVMIICFVLLMAYLNSSGETTTFMIKLVGISLITVLLILGVISNFTLDLSEIDYDNQRMAEINANKESIIKDNFSELPEEISYILRSDAGKDITHIDREIEILYVGKDIDFSEVDLLKGEEKELNLRIKDNLKYFRNKFPLKFDEEIKKLAIEEYRKSRQYKNLLESQEHLRTRHYREAGENYLYYDFDYKNYRYEIGYPYIDYRIHTHKNARFLFFLVMVSTILILVIFPKFFRSSLVKPLNNLLEGVHSVNQGDLSIQVEIKVHDEIGFLADSFNSMVTSIRETRQELQDYASNLEDKVLERTTELQHKMHEVNTLKVQQDGDYFLTSLLSRPLFLNSNKSSVVLTEFYISQKKKFEFRNKQSELGGDICITDMIRLGTPKKFRNYIVALNGDAMGKSMQGAGGSLVMGVVIHSIIARASGDKILNTTPIDWMTETYHECNSVFKSFNGTMILSAALALIDESNGDMFYWNAEHPFTVLYRDGVAGFIEDSLQLRKLGLDSEIPFRVRKYKLEPGDIVIIASDGRDDIDLTPEDEIRTINEDENMFLDIVLKSEANIDRIIHSLRGKGTITDDLSILRIEYIPIQINEEIKNVNYIPTEVEISPIEESGVSPDDKEYSIAVNFYNQGNLPSALEILKKMVRNGNRTKDILRLCGLLAYKLNDYRLAEFNLYEYNRLYNKNYEVLHFLSLARKKLDDYHGAIDIGIDLLEMQPDNIMNYLYLSDLYALIGKEDISRELLSKASEMEPENRTIQELLSK